MHYKITQIFIIVFFLLIFTAFLFNTLLIAENYRLYDNVISSLALALDIYALDTGTYPTTQHGLQALIDRPDLPPLVVPKVVRV